jgi:hypothetical protein
MLRVFIDQDFNHDILRGLRLRLPALDVVTALEARLDQKSDPDVLDWAAQRNRIVVTHDRQTMPRHAWSRVTEGTAMPGVFVVSRDLPTGDAIAELELLINCSQPEEWSQMVVFIPLRP